MMQVRYVAVAMIAVLLAAAAGFGAPPAGTGPASSAAPATARAVIEKVTQSALAVLRDASLSAADKRERVRQIAYDNMDFDTLARLALGRPWRTLSDAKKAEFVAEFKKHVAATYGHTTDQYTDEDIKVTGDRDEADGDSTVDTSIIGTKDGVRQEVAKVGYRMRKKDGKWNIIDVNIDGISLMGNFREQFQEIMDQGGIDQVIKSLREKNAAAEKTDSK